MIIIYGILAIITLIAALLVGLYLNKIIDKSKFDIKINDNKVLIFTSIFLLLAILFLAFIFITLTQIPEVLDLFKAVVPNTDTLILICYTGYTIATILIVTIRRYSKESMITIIIFIISSILLCLHFGII